MGEGEAAEGEEEEDAGTVHGGGGAALASHCDVRSGRVQSNVAARGRRAALTVWPPSRPPPQSSRPLHTAAPPGKTYNLRPLKMRILPVE